MEARDRLKDHLLTMEIFKNEMILMGERLLQVRNRLRGIKSKVII